MRPTPRARSARSARSLTLVFALAFVTIASVDGTAQTPLTFESPAPKAGGNFGISVAPAGDMNHDGFDDFLIGAEEENGDGPLNGLSGRIYVVSGATGNLIWNISPPQFQGQRYGTSVAGDCDIDGDGTTDVIAGSLSDRVLVFSGATADTILVLVHPTGAFSTSFGAVVGNAGDFDNDGDDDIIVGAYNETIGARTRAGRAYVFGSPNGNLLATLESPLNGDGQFGIAVNGAGDVDNDGFDDVIVGAFIEKVNGLSDAGRAYVFSGATHDTLFTLQAPVPTQSAQFGNAVDGLGDINGDNRADVIVGAIQDHSPGSFKSGRAYVFDGATGSPLYELDSPTPDFNGFFAKDVAGIGDYDADGTGDIVVGAYTEDEGGVNGSGRAHVFSGATGAHLDTFVSPNLENFGRFGVAVAAAGDTNGDGAMDVVVGAGLEAVAGLNDAGRAYLFRAPTPTPAPVAVGPRALTLHPNVPNPFNPTTVVHFELRTEAQVKVQVHDLSGRLVDTIHDGVLPEGAHRIRWQATDRASGTYLLRVAAGEEALSQKLLLLK